LQCPIQVYLEIGPTMAQINLKGGSGAFGSLTR
jgi:hypothetical protein